MAFPTEGWHVGTPPEEVSAPLGLLLDQAFDSKADTLFGMSLAFVAIHRGQLVAERYGPTAGPDHQLISWSMAKSIAHALIGIATESGGLDIFAPAPVPEWNATDDPRSAITTDQLLRMVSGLVFNEDYVDEETSHCIDMLFGDGAEDMAAYILSLIHI